MASTNFTRRQAEKIIRAKRPHSEDCNRYETNMWDRSGRCERCTAWVSLNAHMVPRVPA
jgi:hypothetical protein